MQTKNKIFACATVMALFCSFLVASVSATDDTAPREPTPEAADLAADSHGLTAMQANATITSDGDPILYQSSDDSSTADSLIGNVTGGASDNMPVATAESSPDYTRYSVLAIGLVVVIALSSVVIIFMKRRK